MREYDRYLTLLYIRKAAHHGHHVPQDQRCPASVLVQILSRVWNFSCPDSNLDFVRARSKPDSSLGWIWTKFRFYFWNWNWKIEKKLKIWKLNFIHFFKFSILFWILTRILKSGLEPVMNTSPQDHSDDNLPPRMHSHEDDSRVIKVTYEEESRLFKIPDLHDPKS